MIFVFVSGEGFDRVMRNTLKRYIYDQNEPLHHPINIKQSLLLVFMSPKKQTLSNVQNIC